MEKCGCRHAVSKVWFGNWPSEKSKCGIMLYMTMLGSEVPVAIDNLKVGQHSLLRARAKAVLVVGQTVSKHYNCEFFGPVSKSFAVLYSSGT
jgi:hypothetical protein